MIKDEHEFNYFSFTIISQKHFDVLQTPAVEEQKDIP